MATKKKNTEAKTTATSKKVNFNKDVAHPWKDKIVVIDESIFETENAENTDERYYVFSGIPESIYKSMLNEKFTIKSSNEEGGIFWYELEGSIYSFPATHLKIVND